MQTGNQQAGGCGDTRSDAGAACGSGINSEQDGEAGGFDPPVVVGAEAAVRLSPGPEIPADVDGGVGIEREARGVDEEIEHEMREAGDPDGEGDGAAAAQEEQSEERGPDEDHEQGVGPVVEEAARRVLRLETGAGEGDPEEVGQEGRGEQRGERGARGAGLDGESGGEVGGVHRSGFLAAGMDEDEDERGDDDEQELLDGFCGTHGDFPCFCIVLRAGSERGNRGRLARG